MTKSSPATVAIVTPFPLASNWDKGHLAPCPLFSKESFGRQEALLNVTVKVAPHALESGGRELVGILNG